MKNIDTDSLKNEFRELAESDDVWKTDMSLTLFRKKLKNIGIVLSDVVDSLNTDTNEQIKTINDKIDNNTTAINSNINNINTANIKSLDDYKRVVDDNFNYLKNQIKIINNNMDLVNSKINLLFQNDKTLATALQMVADKLGVNIDLSQITLIDGGGA